MKKVLKLFVAVVAVTILCGCSQTNSPTSNGTSGDNSKPKTGKIVFSNQSGDNYHVAVESKNFADQFDISGNKNETKTYELTGYSFIIRLTQADGYVLYPTEHLANVPLTEEGFTICWDNDTYWLR